MMIKVYLLLEMPHNSRIYSISLRVRLSLKSFYSGKPCMD